jgi:hypothetical protein
MNIILPTMATLSAGTLVFFGKNMDETRPDRSSRGLHMFGFRNINYCPQGEVIAQKGNSAGTLNSCEVPQAISKEDYKFLDDIVQQQDQDNERQRKEKSRTA